MQTAGSAGESIAFGLGVTMPAIMILGFDLEITRVMLVAVLGGLLGILMMIPLRRALIVQQHGVAEVSRRARPAPRCSRRAPRRNRGPPHRATGRGARPKRRGGAGPSAHDDLHRLRHRPRLQDAMVALQGLEGRAEKVFGAPFKAGSIAAGDLARAARRRLHHRPAHRPRIMCAGGVLAYLVLIPVIKFFGAGIAAAARARHQSRSRDMTPDEIRSAYVLYIGAGAVAAGGIISLIRGRCRSSGTACKRGLADFGGAARRGGATVRRTEQRSVDEVRAGRRHRRCSSCRSWLFAPLHMNLLRRAADRRLRLPVRHRLVAADRRDRLLLESDLRHDRGDAAADLPDLPDRRLDRRRRTTSPRSRSAPSSASPRRTAAPPRRT